MTLSRNQIVNEQPLDLSKKEALAISTTKESDTSSRNTSSPCEQKDDNNPAPNVDNDDLEDSPLVIDEETTTDPVEVKRTPPTGEIIVKVIMDKKQEKELKFVRPTDENYWPMKI